jgi:hypothetical protein
MLIFIPATYAHFPAAYAMLPAAKVILVHLVLRPMLNFLASMLMKFLKPELTVFIPEACAQFPAAFPAAYIKSRSLSWKP